LKTKFKLIKNKNTKISIFLNWKVIFDKVIEMVNLPASDLSSKCVFIDGPGGTGKTYLFEVGYSLENLFYKKVLS
jgi:hypothetical protein